MQNKFTSAFKVSSLALVLSFGLSYVYAWTAPTSNPPAGNVAAPINTSAVSQTKAGDIAVNGATHFLDTGTTIPSIPAGGTAAVAGNGWPNYSDVAANAVKLAGLTSADILSAQTASTGGMSQYVAYGNTTCATGWTTAYTGYISGVHMSGNSATLQGTGGAAVNTNYVCSGGDYLALTASMGTAQSSFAIFPATVATSYTKVMSCAVCVR